jgi:hypothetical protein
MDDTYFRLIGLLRSIPRAGKIGTDELARGARETSPA